MSKTEINIFLASSTTECSGERKGFANFLRNIEKRHSSKNIRFNSEQFEFESGALTDEESQEKYDNLIRKSDVIVIIFKTKAGIFTVREFELALNQLKKQKIQILLFYKKPNKEITDEALLSIKRKMREKNQFPTNDYSDLNQFERMLADELANLVDKQIIGKTYTTLIKANILNQNFQPSLISFNIIKYLTFNRKNYINIWIGSQYLYNEIQYLERRISWNSKTIKYREWTKINAADFNYIHNTGTVFLIVSNENDYLNLYNNISYLPNINNLIICFDFDSVAVSKLYAAEVYLQLAENNNIKLITENKYTSKKPLELGVLKAILNKQILLLRKHGITKNDVSQFIKENDFNTDILLEKTKKNLFLNLILKFGEHEHKLKVIELFKDFDNVIYQAIKTNIHLLKYFINGMDETRFKALIEQERRLPCLLKVVDINLKESFKTIVNNKLPNNYTNKKYIEPTVDIYPTNNIQFWILLTKHNKLKQYIFNKLSTATQYLSTISSPYSLEELTKIQGIEKLKQSYKLISENEIVYNELSAIEQNLLLYEI